MGGDGVANVRGLIRRVLRRQFEVRDVSYVL